MLQSTLVFYFVFAALTVIGGFIGFVKAKSRASLIAGLISGALLDLSACLLIVFRQQPLFGLGLGTTITLVLLARFVPAFLSTKKFMPAGMMSLLGTISLVFSVLALLKL